jgi:methylmalonyl-CoA/ethylmalonyl-CoA epimerase
MRLLGKTVVAMFAVIGVIASIQQLRGQAATPLDGATLDHIGIVTRDVDKTVKLMEETFGITIPAAKVTGPILLPGEAPGTAQYKVKFTRAQIGKLTIEMIEPAGGTGPHKDHLDKFGQGMHHIAFFVKDPQGTLKFLTNRGGKLTMNNLYADLKDQLGFTLEVAAMPKPAQ